MAPRYWVGGTASWDGTAGTKWAATSGGPGGETVPTTADDVYFDGSSGAVTVTIAVGNTGAKSITCTGFTGTLTGSAAITVAGGIALVSGMTCSHTGMVTITGTGTLTTAGNSFGGVTVDGVGITVTLGDALNSGTRTIFVTNGTFTTNNYSVTCGQLASSNTNRRQINLGSSTVTLQTGGAVNFGTANDLTFNAGTSQINVTASTNITINGGSQTFYNFSITNTSTSSNRAILGSNTFNNLTFVAGISGYTPYYLSGDQTVNGTLTCSGNTSTQRCFIASNGIGTVRTITAAAISASDCDFRDITLSGAAAGTSPTRAGDCGGNSGITFPAAKTVYRVGTSTTWPGTSSWALTSGGSGSNNNFPLPQDTIVIDNNTALTGTLSNGFYNLGTLDCSSRTNAITLNYTSTSNWYGNHTFGSGVSLTGTATQFFQGRGTMNMTSAGKNITFRIQVESPGGTFRLADALSTSNGITLSTGTLNANNYSVSCFTFNGTGGSTRTLTMGSGLWTLTGAGTVWNTGNPAGLTFNKDTANILLSDTSTSARSFSAGTLSFNKLTIGGSTGTSTLTFDSSASFTELASTKTVAHTIITASGFGTIGTWSITGTAGNVVTFQSSTTSRRDFTLTNVTSGIDYLSVKDIGEISGNKFYVGANSTDGGNNNNVIFTAPPVTTARGNMLMLF